MLNWRGAGAAVFALILAWFSWTFSPRLIALAGLSDLETLGQMCAVVATLSAAEYVFAFVCGADTEDH